MSSDEQPAGLSPVERFSARLKEAQEEFERERRAEILAAVNKAEQDRDPLEYVRALAGGYEERRGDSFERVRYLDSIARELTPADLRALRVAAEAVKKITPLVIRIAADEEGMTPAQIADDLGMTESYVYRVLRDHRANFDSHPE
ncbi:helix-turn-helix domain-containing protein [Streptomyces sp. NPDC007074]|uniref:helix-turn-helix domain-containing protein n=1 Tax=Streptomyces sp. NPDC007074 TaxID=3156764 RepID=UPI0034029AF5